MRLRGRNQGSYESALASWSRAAGKPVQGLCRGRAPGGGVPRRNTGFRTVRYNNVKLDVGFRVDLLVENVVIVEIKGVEGLAPLHKAQVLTYLRISGKPVGLLINF